MHHLICGISSHLYSVNLIVLTLLLVYLILHISPHDSHHLCSHHLSVLWPFTPDLKLISFTNPLLHSHSYSFRTAFTGLYWIKGALSFVLVSFFLAMCARLSWILKAFKSMLNSSAVSYRVSYLIHMYFNKNVTLTLVNWNVINSCSESPSFCLTQVWSCVVVRHCLNQFSCCNIIKHHWWTSSGFWTK